MAKGRDKKLIELRDEALCRRYYYWTEVQRLRFDDALEVKPVPKVKKPRLTAVQLSLFTGE